MTSVPKTTTNDADDQRVAPLGSERLPKLIHPRDALSLAVIGVFFLAFFWRIWIRQELPLIGDPLAYTYPMRLVLWDMIREGTLPLWTPLIFSGYPLLSMAQLGIGYPLTWGYAFLPGHWAETLYVIAPFLLAPAFLYAYARTLGRGRLASILAGLSFAYGGMMASKLSNGMLPNAVMWLPVLLIALERARRGRFVLCLVGGAAAYSMSVLTGIGQGIVLTGLVAGAYAVVLAGVDFPRHGWRALRPVGVALGAALLAVGVASFQILESWQAVRLSVRNELTYEIFGQLSLPVWQAVQALWIPLYYHVESAPYLPPLVLALALLGSVTAVRRPGRHHQALFWLVVAIISALLIPGIYSPFYRVLFHVPVLNKFRGSSRNSFGWTLGLSILGAYGWDALSLIRSRIPQMSRPGLLKIVILVSGALSIIVAWLWESDVAGRVPIASETALGHAGKSYLLFKITFVVLTTLLLWCVWRVRSSSWRSLLLTGSVAWVCFVEPSLFMTYAWAYPAVPTSWFTEPRRPMEFLTRTARELERVYLRVVGFDIKDLEPDNLDFLNLAARRGLQNVAGYEPLMLQRYSRALGDVWLDGVRGRLASPPDFSLFDPKGHVLDILGASLVAGYSNLEVSPPRFKEVNGVRFAGSDFPRDHSGRLTAMEAEGDSLAVVSFLSHSTHLQDDTPVAKLSVRTLDGRTIERELLAGRDTSEWAHEKPDVRRAARHRLAPFFDRYPADEQGSFYAYRYLSRIPLGERVDLDRVDISELIPGVPVTIAKATLVDEANQTSTPLIGLSSARAATETSWLHDRSRWQKVYDRDEVLILKNSRALPRAWLVGSMRVVSEEEALASIRGMTGEAFDPRQTVLLETMPREIDALPNGSLPAEASARVTHFEPNRLSIETASPRATVLVVGEINYPGWEATIDGRAARIYAADYLLRALPLTAGEHRIDMRYRAPGARRGAVISICTMLLLGGMLLYAVIGKGRRDRSL